MPFGLINWPCITFLWFYKEVVFYIGYIAVALEYNIT